MVQFRLSAKEKRGVHLLAVAMERKASEVMRRLIRDELQRRGLKI